MLLDTVFDGLESQLSLKVDKTKVIFLRMPYKGKPVPAVIRRKMDTKPDEVIRDWYEIFYLGGKIAYEIKKSSNDTICVLFNCNYIFCTLLGGKDSVLGGGIPPPPVYV